VANAVSEGHITVVPEVLVTGGGGSIEGLAATLMRTLGGNGKGNGQGAAIAQPQPQPQPTVDAPPPEAAVADVELDAADVTNREPIPPPAP
jgi:hypothetical protein